MDATTSSTEREGCRIAGRVLLAAAAVLVASSGVARGIGYVAEHVGRAPFFYYRLTDTTRMFPTLARDPNAVPLFGTSHVAGIFPDVMDSELQRWSPGLHTFNLGMAQLTSPLYRDHVHRLTNAYRNAGTRAPMIVMELGLTDFSETPDPRITDTHLLRVGTPADFLSRASDDLESGLRLFGRRYLMGGFSGEYIAYRAQRWLEMDVPRWFGDESDVSRRAHEFPTQRLQFPEWAPRATLANRGSEQVLPEYVSIYRDTFAADSAMRAAQLPGDLEDEATPFIEANVVAMIEAVKDAQTICPNVFLVVTPRNPCAPARSPDVEARTALLIARFRRETGAPLLDFTTGVLTRCDDFVDLFHLEKLTAASVFSRELGRRLVEVLREEEPGTVHRAGATSK